MTVKHADIQKTITLEKIKKDIETRAQKGMFVFLASLHLPENSTEQIKESLDELEALVRTLGDQTKGTLIQKRPKPVPGTYIGTGKAEEIRDKVAALKVDYVAFDQDLSPTQVRNLEQIIGRPVLDRTGIILQIFRQNARSREARTQVEIAHLEYLAPRLSNAWIAWERQRGSGGSGGRLKGMGETQIEIDRRRIKDKISHLKKELKRIKRERDTQRKMRSNQFNVSLVGYTNAGKTTLMNALTASKLSAKDALFETLDSTVRKLRGGHGLNILVKDTVGFIRNLPHSLVASFQSTLEEVAESDLILHVIDISNPAYKDHIAVTEDVLTQIHADHVPTILVFNKFDKLIDEPNLPKILAKAYPNSMCISSQNNNDINQLINKIVDICLVD